ncbi:MAG: NADH-quinone oxidoreductase subunit L [Desulfovibrio sp.]|nr:NADH-quinone oxidoreductase subunit L [Desulfovibrio sp.]
MHSTLMFILIVLPFLAAIACAVVPVKQVRSAVVVVTGALLVVASLLLIGKVPFETSFTSMAGLPLASMTQLADFLLLGFVLFLGWKHKHLGIKILAGAQLVILFALEAFMMDHHAASMAFVADPLSLTLVLIISIVGSIICIHAIPYMDNHEHHLHLTISRQPRFFAWLVVLLGTMNALVLTNDLLAFYFFFELTTLCSYMLIGHDGTEEATNNSVRALYLGSMGGLALLLGAVFFQNMLGSLEIQEIIKLAPSAGYAMLPMALLCVAAFVKSAQAPFQSWLLGAMVAPTPTSALLHSSTMVKAGVYLVLRMAPGFVDTTLSTYVALFGAFTFLATALLAVSQSNAKRILAYSTVSNLGLIIACAGINTPAATAAALFLIIFHAVSKALLFLCVGTIEQRIESRDIEDMHGLFVRMPVTASLAVIGVLTMILPPFGMLMGKWMAIESAAANVPVIMMLALGSAITLLYWARWAGLLMSHPLQGGVTPEVQPKLTKYPLVALCGGAVLLSLLSPWIYSALIVPMIDMVNLANPQAMFEAPYVTSKGMLGADSGVFPVAPLFLVLIVGMFLGLRVLKNAQGAREASIYLAGAQSRTAQTPDSFVGPVNQPVKVANANYYLTRLLPEGKVTCWVNTAAVLLALLLVVGGL